VSADPIGDALHADAEAARAEIRAAGIVCASCGVNMADLGESHMLTLTQGREFEDAPLRAPTAKCEYGALVQLGTASFEEVRAAASVALYEDFRACWDEAVSQQIVGTGPAHFTGLLDTLGSQP
jgi:hypothetical protein